MTAYNIVAPSSMQAGQPEDVSVILANLQAIAGVLNGQIDNANLSPAADIAASKFAGFPSDASKVLRGDGSWATVSVPSSIPLGALMMWPTLTAPTDWLLCDGASLLRTDYAALFAVIGVVYGAVDGTHFTLPDLRGRVPVGRGSNALVSTLGNNDGVAEANRRPKHRHTAHAHTTNAHVITSSWSPGSAGGGTSPAGWSTATVNGADGGSGTAADSLDAPAYQVVNYIIKAV